MNQSLVNAGAVCMIAAIVGGGVEALGAKMPVLYSKTRQLPLAGFGIVLMLIGFFNTSASKNEKTDANRVSPLRSCTIMTRKSPIWRRP